MKKFSIHKDSVRSVLSFALVGVLISVAYFANPTFLKTPSALSAMSDNVYGYAWSENIGWISLNSINCDQDNDGWVDLSCGGFKSAGVPNNGSNIPVKDYGVNIEQSSGNFSGYAWSENIGWIKFDPTPDSTTGLYPSAPQHGAQLNTATKVVTGWARACAGTVNGDCTGESRADGWDGWIKLSKDSADTGSAYNVAVTAGKFSGWAWGGDVVGWIDFAPEVADIFVGAQVSFNAPLCTAAIATDWGSCAPLWSCSESGTTTGIESGTCYFNEIPSGTATRGCSATVSTCPAGVLPESVTPVLETPLVTITAFPNFTTLANPTAIITYSTNGDPVSCTASGEWSGPKTVSSDERTEQVGPFADVGVYTYGLTCGGKYYYALVTVSLTEQVPYCGDTQCNGNETTASCPQDCSAEPVTPGKPKTGQF